MCEYLWMIIYTCEFGMRTVGIFKAIFHAIYLSPIPPNYKRGHIYPGRGRFDPPSHFVTINHGFKKL